MTPGKQSYWIFWYSDGPVPSDPVRQEVRPYLVGSEWIPSTTRQEAEREAKDRERQARDASASWISQIRAAKSEKKRQRADAVVGRKARVEYLTPEEHEQFWGEEEARTVSREIGAALLERFPKAEVLHAEPTYRQARHRFAVQAGNRIVIVEWQLTVGFGVYPEECGPAAGPIESFADLDAVLARVAELLRPPTAGAA